MTRAISNCDDLIDSRDVIARINELIEERDDLQQVIYDDVENPESMEAAKAAREALLDWKESDEGLELDVLLRLQDEAEGGDWEYGETLIRDSYFEQYAQDLAEDIGAVNNDTDKWPFNHIDWEAAADELKQDYTCVDYDGVDYWIRTS
jgi:hypothetical protein